MPEENAGLMELEDQQDELPSKECSTCKWWTRILPLESDEKVWGFKAFHFGECRATPPSALSGDKKLIAQNDESGRTFVFIKQARFPHTNHDDWCGVWNARE